MKSKRERSELAAASKQFEVRFHVLVDHNIVRQEEKSGCEFNRLKAAMKTMI